MPSPLQPIDIAAAQNQLIGLSGHFVGAAMGGSSVASDLASAAPDSISGGKLGHVNAEAEGVALALLAVL